jgi:ribosome modulation factor
MVKHIYINVGRKVADTKSRDASASPKVKAHSQFTQGDYDYLKGKGWSDEQIITRWNEEAKGGSPSQKGNKSAKPGEPGYMSAHDASNRFVTKKDIRLPAGEEWERRSGSVMPSGTIVYKEGSGYRPHWYNGSARLNLSASDLTSADTDAAPDLAKLQADLELARKNMRAAKNQIESTKYENEMDALEKQITAARKQARDAMSPVEAAQKAIDVQQRLIEACKKHGKEVPGTVLQRLKFLEEELAKAKSKTEDADQTDKLESHRKGFEAGETGVPRTKNPYSSSGQRQEFEWWNEGWDKGNDKNKELKRIVGE